MRRRRNSLLRALLLVWLSWLVVGNLALNVGLAESLINRKPEGFQLHWSHGLSLWPGQAWLWQVQARGQVRTVVWQAHADRVVGRVALLPLLVKQVRVPSLVVHELRFELDRAEHDRPPLAPRPGGWTISLGSIHSDSVVAARAGDLDLEGRGTLRLALVKQLRGGPIEIQPSQFRIGDARLRRGDEVLAEPVDAQLDLTLARHRRERTAGWAQLALADAHLRLMARSAGLAVALDEAGRWRTSLLPLATLAGETAGRIEVELSLREGALLSGGRVDVQLPLRADVDGGEQWQEQATLQLAVDDAETRLHVLLPPPPGDAGHIDAQLHMIGRTLPFTCTPAPPEQAGLGPACELEPIPDSLSARIGGEARLHWHFDSLRWFGPLLARMPWLHLDGSGDVDAKVRIEQGRLAPGSRVRVPRLDARIDVLDNHIEGEAHAEVGVEADAGGRPRTQLGLVVDRFQIASKDTPDQVQARGRDLRLDVDALGTLNCLWLERQVAQVRGSDCGENGEAASLQARLRFDQAEVPALAVYAHYLPGESIRLLGGSGRLSGDLHLDAVGEVGHGRLDISASAARLAIADLELEGDLQLRTQLQRADLERREFELDGTTLHLDRVRALDGARMLGQDWWLHATIEQGQVRWGQPLTIDARVHADARDIALVMDLFARRTHYPRWTLRLLDAGAAHLQSRLRLAGDSVRLDPLHAHNDRFDVRARLRIEGRQPTGDLLLGWGRLQAGLELADGERHWHLRRPSDWFNDRGKVGSTTDSSSEEDGGAI